MARVLNWNGRNVPPELRALPPGRYVVEAIDLAPELTAEEEEGLAAGLASLRRGGGIPAESVRVEMRALIGAKPQPRRKR